MDLDPATLYHIEFEAGVSSHIALSNPLITVAKSLITQSEARIVEIKAQLETLLAEEQLRLGRLRKAIAPYKRLPNELLFRIMNEEFRPFQWELRNNGYTPDPRSSPWIFRQVCGSWRQVALSYHQLWNNLVFSTDRRIDHRSHLDFWVHNIRNDSAVISVSRVRDVALAEIVLEKIVIPYRQSLISLDTVANEAFSHLPPRCFPMMEDLEMSFCVDGNESFPDASCFAGMDRLRSLSLDGYKLPIPITIFPRNQLTSISLSNPLDFSLIIQLLHRCHTTLTYLNIHVVMDPTTFIKCETPHFLIPHLRKFKLSETIPGTLPPLRHIHMTLINYLTLPGLDCLGIYLNPSDQDVDFPAVPLTGLFERSKCPLDLLTIHSRHSTISRSELPLDNLRSLTILSASNMLFSHTTISQILAREVIPKIRFLNIAILDTNSVERFTEFLETTTVNGHPLWLTIFLHPLGVTSEVAVNEFVCTVQPFLDRACRKGRLAVVTVGNDGGKKYWEGNRI